MFPTKEIMSNMVGEDRRQTPRYANDARYHSEQSEEVSPRLKPTPKLTHEVDFVLEAVATPKVSSMRHRDSKVDKN